jgi:hypothetical protein
MKVLSNIPKQMNKTTKALGHYTNTLVKINAENLYIKKKC